MEHIKLRDFLVARVRESCGLEQHEEDALREHWRASLRGLLTTPRDITRLTNTLAVVWSAIADHAADHAEVFDFIGIETIGVTKPKIWEVLRDRRRELVGERDPMRHVEGRAPSLDEVCGADASSAVRRLVGNLFPLTEGGSHTPRLRAICSPASVDVYFCFQPGSAVGRSFLDKVLQSLDSQTLADQLKSMDNRAQLRSAISDLTDRITDVPNGSIEIFCGVCDVGDILIGRPREKPPALHDIELFRDLDELLWKSLRNMPSEQREPIASQVIQSSPAIMLPAIMWQQLALRGGYLNFKTSNPEPLVSSDAVDRLGLQLAQRLSAEAKDGSSLAGTPMLGWVLKTWGRTQDTSGLLAATHQLVRSDLGLVNIVDGLMGHGVSSASGEYRTMDSDERIGELGRAELVSLVHEALNRDDFPRGISKPLNRAIARQVLEAYERGNEDI